MTTVNEALKEAMELEGAIAVALVDHTTGMTLGTSGDTVAVNLDVAAAGNTEVVRAKMRTVESLGQHDRIEDILISMSREYHLMRMVESFDGLFLYLVLSKERSNLAMARFKLAALEKTLEI